ncbi:MAG TPA: hypothetical protein VKC61_19190 [Pyrinomonadaceae bacterium]|nr:hypothetical protein [Pyrinomonadaceae bacterium]
MSPTNQTKRSDRILVIPVLILLATCIGKVRGQQPGSNHPMRDQVRAVQRAEMDRILLLSLPARANNESSRAAAIKQIRADFKDLQELNNRMMAEAWAHETLDYSFLSEMVSRIRGRAARLKANLNLPDSGHVEKAAADANVSDSNQIRAALLVLDRTIMSFVNNPYFKEPNAIQLAQATKARQDLESMIQLAVGLKKLASKLAKVPKSH